MALLERGKGKRKTTIEVVQHGDVLRMQEVESGDTRLPGYRRYPTAAAAEAALIAEVQKLAADGMTAADAAAKKIVAAIPATAPGAALPLRKDIGIYNEATGFVITSRKMAGKALDEGSAGWKKAVANGDMLPMSLLQDDPLIVRIVAGAPLNDEEQAQWIARVDSHLNIPDGKLCITGGAVFANEEYDAEEASWERFVAEVAIPKGRYRAMLYSVAGGVNDGGEGVDGGDKEMVDFVLHLEPVDVAPKSGLTPLPKDGWFTGEENARTIATPRGLDARDVMRKEASDGKWSFVYRAFESLPAFERRAITGDAVTLPLDSIAHAGWIAWFTSRFTTIELRLSAPAGDALDLTGTWPEGMIGVVEDGTGRILFDADLDLPTVLDRLHELAPRLAALPDGTILEVCSVAHQVWPGSPEGAGTMSLRGVIRNGRWHIEQAYPHVAGAMLNGALAIGAAVRNKLPLTFSDPDEESAIRNWATSRFGSTIDPAQFGIAAFMHRFANIWPCADLQPLDSEQSDEDDTDSDDESAKPITGAELFVAASGRRYHQTMALLLSDAIAAEVQKRERPLLGAKFMHVGDLVCSESDTVAYRAYAQPGGTAWAYFQMSAPSTVTLKIASTFDDSESVVTDAQPNENAKSAVERHADIVNEIESMFGAPHQTEPKLRAFAQALEIVFLSS